MTGVLIDDERLVVRVDVVLTRRFCIVYLAKRVRAEALDLGRELGAILDELRPFGGRQIEHLHARAAQPELI